MESTTHPAALDSPLRELERSLPLPRSTANLAQHELLGLPAMVVADADPSLVGISGIVRDESREMFEIEAVDHRRLRLSKRGCTLAFTLPDGTSVTLEGAALAFRPEDRPKRARLSVGHARLRREEVSDGQA